MERKQRVKTAAVAAYLAERGLPEAFPLTPHHGRGRWVRKVRGKQHDFGPIDDAEGARRRWLEVADELQAGLEPRAWRTEAAETVGGVRAWWLGVKSDEAESGAIKDRTLVGYADDTRDIAAALGVDARVSGLGPADFRRLAGVLRRGSPAVATRRVTITRMMFKAAYEDGVIETPPRFGSGFKGGSRKEAREKDAATAEAVFEREQVLAVLRVLAGGGPGCRPSPGARAGVLLGINGGFTQLEVGNLRRDDVDLDAGVVWMLREKTNVKRVVPLWPETVEAIRTAAATQPPASAERYRDRLLLTRDGLPWEWAWVDRVEEDGRVRLQRKTGSALTQAFSRAMASSGHRVAGAGFGKLRATHRTRADGALDVTASRAIMGQEPDGIDRHYVRHLTRGTERFDAFWPRLQRVSEHVRGWLWPHADAEGVVGRIG